jgi:hypothetical protein
MEAMGIEKRRIKRHVTGKVKKKGLLLDVFCHQGKFLKSS